MGGVLAHPAELAHRDFLRRRGERIDRIESDQAWFQRQLCDREPPAKLQVKPRVIQRFVAKKQTFNDGPDLFEAACAAFNANPARTDYLEVVPCDRACRKAHVIVDARNEKFWHSYPRDDASVAIVFNVGTFALTKAMLQTNKTLCSAAKLRIEGAAEFIGLAESEWEILGECDIDSTTVHIGTVEVSEPKEYKAYRLAMVADEGSRNVLAITWVKFWGRVENPAVKK